MKSASYRPKTALILSLCTLSLAGCQTTQNNSFSEWKNVGPEQTRFNSISALNVPVSAVQQRSRNNGQVLDEEFWLSCGEGQIHIEHVPTGWFSNSTISALHSEDKFKNSILKSSKPGSLLENIASVGNENSGRAGYHADLRTPENEVCQVAKFGIRAKQGRTFDNDDGALDTFVELNYCGDTSLNLETFTSELKLATSNNSSPNTKNQPNIVSCPTVFEEPANSEPTDDFRQAELTLIWPGSFYGSQMLNIEHNDTSGQFTVSLSESNQCNGHYEAKSPETPFEARWWLSCSDGQSAKGYFYPETKRSLMGKGHDARGVEILLGMEL